jgi:hypothetical protein
MNRKDAKNAKTNAKREDGKEKRMKTLDFFVIPLFPL